MGNSTKNTVLASAFNLERELGIRHGTVRQLVDAGKVDEIYIPGHKRPKYERKAVYEALGVRYA